MELHLSLAEITLVELANALRKVIEPLNEDEKFFGLHVLPRCRSMTTSYGSSRTTLAGVKPRSKAVR